MDVNNEYQYEINFTDITLSETDGDFKEIDEIMKKEPPYSNKWVIRSNVSIVGLVGMGEMIVQCHGNKKIYILEYAPSIGDLFYNPDIQAFSLCMQDKGWDAPQPHKDLIERDRPFWKHFYDTCIIDSDYFDKASPRI